MMTSLSLKPTTEPTVQDVLQGALASLVAQGWCQNAWHSGQRRCLLAAVSDAGIGATGRRSSATGLVVSLLADERGDLVCFNDSPATTFRDVVELLRCAIDRADQMAEAIRNSRGRPA